VLSRGRRCSALAILAALAACAPAQPQQSPPASTGSPRATTAASPVAIPSEAGSPDNPDGLTDAQLVGQVFVSYVYGSGTDTATPAQRAANIGLYGEPTPAAVVRRWHLGGLILLDHNALDPDRDALSTGNLSSAGQLRRLAGGLQAVARADTGLPLLIGTDQEGGPVQRIPFLPSRPAEQDLAALPATAVRCSYAALGRQLLSLGVNQDYAPDADVVRVSGGVIGNRSFGPDVSVDAADVRAAVDGLQGAGVLATIKHWPGHGSTSTDSHSTLAVIAESAEQWRAVDRPPFAAAAPTVDSIMVGHLALPAVDPSRQPATLSPVLVDGALRHGLGYRGLILTDSLWMRPVRDAGTAAGVALHALRAGNDMLLMPPDLPHAWAGVLQAVRTQAATRREVQLAVRHVLAAKAKIGLMSAAGPACN